jgi:hypothetical protein
MASWLANRDHPLKRRYEGKEGDSIFRRARKGPKVRQIRLDRRFSRTESASSASERVIQETVEDKLAVLLRQRHHFVGTQ